MKEENFLVQKIIAVLATTLVFPFNQYKNHIFHEDVKQFWIKQTEILDKYNNFNHGINFNCNLISKAVVQNVKLPL